MSIQKFLESKPQAVQSPPARYNIDNSLSVLSDSHEEQCSRSPAAAGTTLRHAMKSPPASSTPTPAALPTRTLAGTSKPIPCVASAAATSCDDERESHETTQEDEAVTEYTQCPICQNALFSVSDNDALNRHVDACLNGSMVRRAAKEESLTAAAAAANENGHGRGRASGPSLSPSAKRQRWTDFFGPRS
jgi:hypothetical protein